MLIAETARATSAAESRYRIEAPNSRPRAIMAVALDAGAAALAARLAADVWRGTTFLTAAPQGPRDDASFASWLRSITGQAIDLADAVARADMVQMIASAGEDAAAAALIGEACLLHGVKTSGVVIAGRDAPCPAVSRSLCLLRPWVITLSVLTAADDVGEILRALGG